MSKNDKLPRLLKLIQIIEKQPGLTAARLARECGVGTRQLFRDLKILEYAGVPVYSGQGYRLAGKTFLSEVSFSFDEALVLLYGLKLMERQRELFPVQQVEERLWEILPSSLRAGIENLAPLVEVASGPAVDYTGKTELFRNLHQAIQDSRTVVIDYYCLSRDETNQRQVDPYHLIFKDGFWYLVAFCHWRTGRRLFRVDRIRRIQLLDAQFVPPQDKVASAQIGSAWGMELGEEFHFSIRFWGEAARFVRETQFHPSQQIVEENDGTLCFRASACGLRPVARWVLSFGSEAEVLEPEELRKLVADSLQAAVGRYKKN